MTTLQIEVEDARPVAASCDESYLNVTLADGRILRAPLWWYPRLFAASASERAAIETSPWASIGRKSTRTSASRAFCADRRRLGAKPDRGSLRQAVIRFSARFEI